MGLIDDEIEETGALPSQSKRDNCFAEVFTEPSGRERKTPDDTNADSVVMVGYSS